MEITIKITKVLFEGAVAVLIGKDDVRAKRELLA
jgi:hypothetical protein